jgi:hypothetical protein
MTKKHEPTFEVIVSQLQFTFAKTIAENPHWYVARRPEHAAAFDALLEMYQRNAKPEKWRGRTYRVWRPGDGFKYCALFPPRLIQRKRIDTDESAGLSRP